jgi:hypothetical protein
MDHGVSMGGLNVYIHVCDECVRLSVDPSSSLLFTCYFCLLGVPVRGQQEGESKWIV